MTISKTLTLYSTSHCHLCDNAIAILNELAIYPFTIVEISDSEPFLISYGTKIPVLKREDSKAELSWPFNAKDVVQFLSN